MIQASVTSQLQVRGIKVQVVRKEIKNLHLSVLPPNGRVRVAVPLHISDDRVRAAVATRLPWIKKQQKAFSDQPRQGAREMITGETHYVFGRRCRLDVIEQYGKHRVEKQGVRKLKMYVRPGTTTNNREKLLNEWHREQLKSRIPALLAEWEAKIGVRAQGWGVKKMKTKWGSCNTSAKRIWLNLDLAKKPETCVEYILVHELIHLHERNHNERFRELMAKYLPDWSARRKLLNRAPLAHEDWVY